MSPLIGSTVGVEVGGARLELALLSRSGSRPALMFLHGFGASKEDFADAALLDAFVDRPLAMFDFPGCGASVPVDGGLDVGLLVGSSEAVLDALGWGRCHLIGHSLGGLAGLQLLRSKPGFARSFINVEGNLAPEDCFLSRRALEIESEDPAHFARQLKSLILSTPRLGMPLYVSGLASRIEERHMKRILRSIVEISDSERLMEAFLDLSCPRLFMYGAHSAPPYVLELRQAGIHTVEIPHSGHFPMYSNAPAMWSAIAAFVDAVDG